MRVFMSPQSQARREAAWAFLAEFPAGTPLLVVGDSRRIADEWLHEWPTLRARGASVGILRYSLVQLAARLAHGSLARDRSVATTSVGSRALAARASFDARQEAALTYLEPVAACSGFPDKLAQTLDELRCARVEPTELGGAGRSGPDVSRLAAGYEQLLDERSLVDQARLFELAADRIEALETLSGLVLLDLELPHAQAERLLRALIQRVSRSLATVPEGDTEMKEALLRCGGRIERCAPPPPSELNRLRSFLFSDEAPPEADRDGQVQWFSAPGEARECVEIARGLLQRARAGVPLDRMAVLLPAPGRYIVPLQAALARAGIEACFSSGTQRPDPAGRAFLALLDCAQDYLSVRGFAEYLSFGQCPEPAADGSPPRDRDIQAIPEDDFLGLTASPSPDIAEGALPTCSLRTPRDWEKLLVSAAVIQGQQRWTQRLDDLEVELRLNLGRLRQERPDSSRIPAFHQDLASLASLRAFALPLVEELAAFSRPERWGVWLDRLERLAPLALAHPYRVLVLLKHLRPLAEIGPVELAEVRQVLTDPLTSLTVPPPANRYGRLFVGTPEDARGRSFAVVFVPGLSERVFPGRIQEDPLLLDHVRTAVANQLTTNPQRAERERLRLRLIVGAAEEGLVLSYSRLETSGKPRPKVPSFYALEVMRAILGRVPSFEELAEEARRTVYAPLAWPAPVQSEEAIDDFEHDLASLRGLLQAEPAEGRGRGRYLVDLNEHLRSAVRARQGRWAAGWTDADGITSPPLARHHLTKRPYAPTALERFSRCPYQFWLAAVYRLRKREGSLPLGEMDPLTRGSLFHEVVARLVTWLRHEREESVLVAALEEELRTVADHYAGRLYPAVPRLWEEEVRRLRLDLREWLKALVAELPEWEPLHNELGFGLPPDNARDAASHGAPVLVGDRWLLRGSIDSVERHRTTGELRVTDYKTGWAPQEPPAVVGGGAVLQPVLYGLAAERLLDTPVRSGRLYYCTLKGGFQEHRVNLDEHARRLGEQVLTLIQSQLERGVPAAPSPEACSRCDFCSICGPQEERRTAVKPEFEALARLRALP